MKIKDIAKKSIEELMSLGADKASVQVYRKFSSELQKEFNGIDLFRDVDAIEVEMKAIKDNRRGVHSFTYSTEDDIIENASKTYKSASESNPDSAYGMAQDVRYSGKTGVECANSDEMYQLLADFEQEKEASFPQITDTTSVVFLKEEVVYLNSMNTEIEYSNGYYHVLSLFSAAENGKHSSMNYTYYPCATLPQRILALNNFQEDYQATIKHMNPHSFTDRFQGEIILTPQVFCQLIGHVLGEIQGLSLIDKNSLFLNDLNKKVFDEKLTLKTYSNHSELVTKDIFTPEGYLNRDDYLIKNGVLKNFIVSEYVANRSDFPMNNIASGAFEVEAGADSLENMIKSIKKGVIIHGISSGNPNKNKDFAGVIKNSYYVEDGQIKYPINEAMITANIVDMFNNIVTISQERERVFGACIVPWMKITGVNIAGK